MGEKTYITADLSKQKRKLEWSGILQSALILWDLSIWLLGGGGGGGGGMEGAGS